MTLATQRGGGMLGRRSSGRHRQQRRQRRRKVFGRQGADIWNSRNRISNRKIPRQESLWV